MKIEKNLIIEKDLSDKIINSLPGIFYLSDTTPSLIRWNHLFEKISGYSSEELGKLRPITFFDPEDHEKMLEAMHTTYTKGNAEIIVKLQCKNGDKIPYYFTGVRIEYKGKTAMLGTGINISERLQAEKALKESEEKYRTLVQNANDAIFITNSSGRFINVNQSACKLSQFTEEELYNMTIFDFAVTADLQKNPFHFEELKMGKTVITERVMQVRNGNIIDIEVTSKFLSDGRMLVFVRDISERKKNEREIINEKNLSDSIINSLPGIFYLFTYEGKYLRWNKNFETVSGYMESELRNMNPFDFIVDEEKEMIAKAIDKAFLQGENAVQGHFLTKSNHCIPYYFTGMHITYNGEKCIAGVGIDFSDRLKVQQEIEETSEKLRELTVHLLNVREEERKRIGREIHDELGQQLTAVKMDISWIEKNLPFESPQIKSKMKNVIQLLDNSNVSIRRILNELRPYILDNYGLSESLHFLGHQFTEHNGIEVIYEADELDSNVPEPLATSIFRIYQEALTNISKYAEANIVKTTLRLQDEQLHLTIADNGKGFDVNANREKKFGLLGMKERVNSHGGVINITSQHSKGTVINVKLSLNVKPKL